MDFSVHGGRAYAYTGGVPFDASLRTVVFIHGGALDHSVWGLQARYFSHHGRAVLAPDLPGHGRSEGPALRRIEDMAAWLIALLDAARVVRTALVGHSMGSLVALDCAARLPERVEAIALIGSAVPMRVSPELLEAARSDEPRARAMINVWSHGAYAQFPGNPGPGSWVIGANLKLMQRAKPGVLHADFSACNDYAAGLERAAQVRCPALLVSGRRDQMTPARGARALASAIPGAEWVELDGSGHNVMAEKPDELLDRLVRFLAR
ncbi:MAG TPA: alpha/beta hydrolase [Burkholderiales bacterium]|nr:alpha/beta hydrolase [Burkholderiales bacterium]